MQNIYKHILMLEDTIKSLKRYIENYKEIPEFIVDWEVSPRISNALRRHNVFTLEEYLLLSYDDIYSIKNLGRKSRKELFEYIRKFYPNYMKGLK